MGKPPRCFVAFQYCACASTLLRGACREKAAASLLCAASLEPSPEHPLWVPLHQCRTQGLAVNPLRDGGMVWELGTAEGVILCFVFLLSGCCPPLLPPGEHSSKRCGVVWLLMTTSILSFPRFGSRAGPVSCSSPENRSLGSHGTSSNRTSVWI